MIDSYVEKCYFGERKKGVIKSDKVVSNSVLGKRGKLKTTENPILSCKEVCNILRIGEIGKDDKE